MIQGERAPTAKTMSVETPPRQRAAVADPEARKFLRQADPVLAPLIDARPDFRPRAWMEDLPPLDAFGTLIFQVAGQQLSVSSTRAIISHLRTDSAGIFRRLPSCSRLTPRCCVTAASRLERARRCALSQRGSSTDV